MNINKDYLNPEIVKELELITIKMIYTIYPTFLDMLRPDINYITGVSYIKTLKKYNPELGSFTTLFYNEARGIVSSEFVRPEISKRKLEREYLNILSYDDLVSTDKYTTEEDLFKLVRQIIDIDLLPFRRNKLERNVSELFIDYYYYSYSMEDIADRLGITKQRVGQLINKTIELLRKHNYILDKYL